MGRRRATGFDSYFAGQARKTINHMPLHTETLEEIEMNELNRKMNGVGWTVAILVGLLALLVIIVQVGKQFYGW